MSKQNRYMSFEVPWVSQPFVPDKFNVSNLVDQKIGRLKTTFPNAKVIKRDVAPQKWIEGQNAYYNSITFTVDLGEDY